MTLGHSNSFVLIGSLAEVKDVYEARPSPSLNALSDSKQARAANLTFVEILSSLVWKANLKYVLALRVSNESLSRMSLNKSMPRFA